MSHKINPQLNFQFDLTSNNKIKRGSWPMIPLPNIAPGGDNSTNCVVLSTEVVTPNDLEFLRSSGVEPTDKYAPVMVTMYRQLGCEPVPI